MKPLRALVSLCLLAIMLALVGFVVQNPGQMVDLRIYQTSYRDVPLVLALFVAFLVGVGISLIFGAYFLVEQSLGTRRLRLENRALERELDALRNLAVEEAAGSESGGQHEREKAAVNEESPGVPEKLEKLW